MIGNIKNLKIIVKLEYNRRMYYKVNYLKMELYMTIILYVFFVLVYC